MPTPAAEMSCSSQGACVSPTVLVMRECAALVDERLLYGGLDDPVLVEGVGVVRAREREGEERHVPVWYECERWHMMQPATSSSANAFSAASITPS